MRINLRGDNVLNSKTEYSRCRLPRLTIDREEWKSAKEKETKRLKETEWVEQHVVEDDWVTEEETNMSEWHKENERPKVKRRMDEEEQRVRKRRKLEPLVNWGSGGEGEDEERIRDWLLGSTEMDNDVEKDGPVRPLLDIAEPSRKLRQLEISFGRCLETDVSAGLHGDVDEEDGRCVRQEDKEHGGEVVAVTEPRMTPVAPQVKKRKKTLKRLAAENKKMTPWLKPKRKETQAAEDPERERVELMELDAPELEDTGLLERLEEAKMKKSKWRTNFDIGVMVKELVESVVSRSVVGKLLEEVVTRSAWRTQINQVWRLLEYDQPLQDIIRKKMERQEAEHRRVFEEMVRDDRVQKVEELRKKFASRRIMGEVTKLEELMQSLDITISREGSKGHQAMPQEQQEDMDWKVVEVSEHALLDQC